MSMRLRGASVADLAKLGIDTEGMSQGKKSIVQQYKAQAGIDIMEGDQYKDTFRILDELAGKWADLSDAERAAITEATGGKRGGSVMASLMENWEDAKDVVKVASESWGSAAKEQQNYAQSIQYSIDQNIASLQKLAADFLSSDLLKTLLDNANQLLKIVDQIVQSLDGKALPAVLGIVAVLKNGGIKKTAEDIRDLFSHLSDLPDKIKDIPNILNRLLSFGDVPETISQTAKSFDDISDSSVELLDDLYHASEGMEGVGKSAASSGAMIGLLTNPITWLVAALGTLVVAAYEAEKANNELQKSAEKLGQEYSATESDIEKYKTSIDELQNKLRSSSTSHEEAREARLELLKIQDEIISKYGDESEKINIVTEAINGQTASLDKLSKAKWQESLNEFNNQNLPGWDTGNQFLHGATDNVGVMLKEIENAKQSIGLGYVSDDLRDQIQEVAGNKVFWSKGRNGTEIITLKGSLDDVYKTILDIQQVTDKDVDPLAFKSLIRAANEASSTLEQYDDFYNQYVLQERIFKDENLGFQNNELENAYLNYKKNYDKYQDAYAEGNKTLMSQQIDELFQARQDLAKTLQEKVISGDITPQVKDSIIKTFSELYPELQSIFDRMDFKIKMPSIKQLDSSLTPDDILRDLTEKGTTTQESIFNHILEQAEEAEIVYGSDAEKVQQLLDYLVEWGVIQEGITDKIAETDGELENGLNDWIDGLTSVQNAMDQLDDAYASLIINGTSLDLGQIDSLRSQFGDLDYFDDFILKVTDANSSSSDLQDAFDRLTSEYIKNCGALESVTEETKNATISMLEQMGVENAEEIVTAALAAKTEELAFKKQFLAATGQEVTEAAYADVVAFLEETNASDELKYSIMNTILATEQFNSTSIDITSKLNNLASLCQAFGETEIAAKAAWAAVNAAESVKSRGEGTLNIGAGADTAMSSQRSTKAGSNKDSWYRLLKTQADTTSAGKSAAGRIKSLPVNYGGGAKTTQAQDKINKGSGGGGGGGSHTPTSNPKKDYDNNKDKDYEKKDKEEKEVEDTYDEFFDFFERRLKVVSDAISLIDTNLENVVGSKAKNSLLDAQMRIYKMQQDEYSGAKKMYQEMADRALEKIDDEDIVKRIKNGAIAIDEFIGKGNEEVVNAINDYTKWAEKVADCKEELSKLKEELRQLELERFKNIAQDWQDVFDLRKNNSIDLIDKQIDLIEETGNLVGRSFYETQKQQTQKMLDTLRKEREELVAEMSRGLSNGTIDKGSDEWLEMINTLSDLEGEIIDTTKDIEELDNSILNIHTEVFERIQDQFSDLDDEISDIVGFLEDAKPGDDFGNWTKEGIAQAGLLAQQYELATKRTQSLSNEISYLKAQYSAGAYSATEYADKLADLTQQQRDSAKAAEDAKKSLISLNKARIDIEITAIQKDVEEYKKLIDVQKQSLQSQKDLHDYEKNIAGQNRNISDIERRLAAMSGDNTASTIAKRKALEKELSDARMELEETEYDHSITSQQDALDQQAEQYETARQAEIDKLNEYLENETQVLSDTFEAVKARALEIGQTIAQTAQEHGIQVSESLTAAWKAGSDAIASYGEVLTPATSEFIAQLEDVEEHTWELQEQADVTSVQLAAMFANRADNLVDELQRSWDSEANLNEMTKALEDSFVHTIDTAGHIGEIVASNMAEAEAATDAVKDAAESAADAFNDMADSASAAGSAARSAINDLNVLEAKANDSSWKSGTPYSPPNKTHYTSVYNAPYSGVQWDSIGGHYKKKAKGLRKADQNELMWTQELGDEVIVSPTRNSILTPIKAGDSVLTAGMTKNLWELAKVDPKQLLEGNGANISAPQIQSNISSVQIGTLVNVEGSISDDNLTDVKQTIQEELKKTFRNINSGLLR